MVTGEYKLCSALGIVLDLMDHIGSKVSVTRQTDPDLRYDEDQVIVTLGERTTTGELFDVRTTTPAGRVVEVTFTDTRTVLLSETEPYAFTCHTCPSCPGNGRAIEENQHTEGNDNG